METGPCMGFSGVGGASCGVAPDACAASCGPAELLLVAAGLVLAAANCRGAACVGAASVVAAVAAADCCTCQVCWRCSCSVSRWICNCCAAKASFNAWTSAAVTTVGAGAAAAPLAAGVPDPSGVSAQAPAVRAASIRAAINRVLVGFMELNPLLIFEF